MTKTTKHAINNSPSTTMKRKTMIGVEKLPPTLLSVRLLEAIQKAAARRQRRLTASCCKIHVANRIIRCI